MVTKRTFCEPKLVRNYFARSTAAQNKDKINEVYFAEALQDLKSFDNGKSSETHFTGDLTALRLIEQITPRSFVSIQIRENIKCQRLKAKIFTQQQRRVFEHMRIPVTGV